MTHVCGGRLVGLNCVSGDKMDEQDNDLVYKVGDLMCVTLGWLVDCIY